MLSQKGYWVDVTSSHEVDARMIQPDGEALLLKIKVVVLGIHMVYAYVE